MNKPQNPHNTFLQFMLRAQHLAQHDAKSDKGYAMLMTSMISIALLSMLAAYTTMANMSKSSTNAYVDGTNTFYAAESGLNKRAQQVRERFDSFAAPTGLSPGQVAKTDPVSAASISGCFPIARDLPPDAGNDFQCRNFGLTYNNNIASSRDSAGNTVIGEQNDNREGVNYIAYTFVADKTKYATGSTVPDISTIDPGQAYAGLKAQEYKYTVYATANANQNVASGITPAEMAAKDRKRTYDAAVAAKAKALADAAAAATTPPTIADPTPPDAADTALVSSYDSKKSTADTANASRAAANNRMNTVLQMDFKSRVVPLFQFGAFYEEDLELNSQPEMRVSGPVHTNGNLKAVALNGSSNSAANFNLGTRFMDKVTAVQDVFVASSSYSATCGLTTNCGGVYVYKGTGNVASGASYFKFQGFRAGGKLTDTEVGAFGTRLKSKVPRLNPPQPSFLREKNYSTNKTGLYYGKADMRLKFFSERAMPFDFTSIKDGSGCNLTTYKIPTDRQNSAALTCTTFTKGQLQSLRQPVVTKSTSTTALTAKNTNIIKALRVAIASSPTPITLVDLKSLIVTTTGWGKVFKEQLALDLTPGGALTSTEIDNLLPTSAPSPAPSPVPSPSASCTAAASLPSSGKASEIVNALCSKLLPAPIQAITSTTNSTDPDVNGGFYNQLKDNDNNGFSITAGAWVKMLQLNIESLTYWNRDGIYVEADSTNKNDLKVAYAAPTTLTSTSGLSTDNLAFIKADPDSTKPAGSFAAQGLAARDAGINATEGGLVFYSNVSDDTDGDGTDDITAPNTNPPVPGKDVQGNPITRVDNYRSYPGTTGIRKSPYGFVISGGVELPGPLTIATDQAAYIQGDYNNPSVVPGSLSQTVAYNPSNVATDDRGFRRQPAAIMADTLTFLSNQCLNNNGQVNCGFNDTLISDKAVVTNGMSINAALLSNIMKSTSTIYNGGLNKYMRHLENWGSTTVLNYSGSMISLGEPLESRLVSVSNTGTVYQRNYNYETNFDSFPKLPPLSPGAVYLQQDVFKRNY